MRVATLLALSVLLGLGCGEERTQDSRGAGVVVAVPERARTAITIGSKAFTESRILAEIYAQGLEAAGYSVVRRMDVGDESTADRELRTGAIDAYPEYTTTALTVLFGLALDDVPRGRDRAYAEVRERYRGRGLVALPTAPLNDSQGVGVPARADKELRSISDLRATAGDLTLAAPPECRERADCLPGLRDAYGLRFGGFLPVTNDERYAALDAGRADAAVIFTTDGRLARGRYRVLTDDRRLFPPYNPMLVVRQDVLRRAGPGVEQTVTTVQRELTTEVMRGLNAAVDIDGRSPQRVAREYLEAYGHLP